MLRDKLRMNRFDEIPPTAGLPLIASDLFATSGDLGAALAALLDTPPLQCECSGTACLMIALITLRRRAPLRRFVIVPAYTCPLVVLAIEHAGLQLRLCDLRQNHFDLDPGHLAALCDAQTLAVIPTHLGGRVADIDSTLTITRRHGAFVIEDAAQALGARQHDQSVGLRGDLGFFSLAIGKGLTTCEGGLLVCRDEELRAELLQTSAAIVPRRSVWEWRRRLEVIGYWAMYRTSLLGLAYGLPRRRALARGDFVTAVSDRFSPDIPLHRLGHWRRRVGAQASTRLVAFLATTAQQARNRVQRLRAIDGIEVFGDVQHDDTGVWPLLMVMLPDQRRRDAALERLWRSPLGVTRMFIHALPDYDWLRDRVPDAQIPNARAFAARMLTISNSPWLDDDGFERIARALEQIIDS